jgi:hypothetical protein
MRYVLFGILVYMLFVPNEQSNVLSLTLILLLRSCTRRKVLKVLEGIRNIDTGIKKLS